MYRELESITADHRLKALIHNDLASLALVGGDYENGRKGFADALALDPRCEVAQTNLALLESEFPGLADGPAAQHSIPLSPTLAGRDERVRVAIVSFLFNWPSTGGGITHTIELAQFLGRAGYCVQHYFARYAPWDIGRVDTQPPFASEALAFTEAEWGLPAIQGRFRQAVDRFAPDYVVITDSWNIKPRLAEALRGHRVILRLQAMECLCPLNNVRLLPEPAGRFRQCPLHQLATPGDCAACVRDRGGLSGGLHQAERALSGVGAPEYHECLLRALREAEAVLVVNPLTEALLGPYARSVRVVTAGMDPARFPWPWPDEPAQKARYDVRTLLFAGLLDERMKGLHVLHDARARWRPW
jgi:hypothetical protein